MANNVEVIGRAKRLVDEILELLSEAEGRFKSARTWSFIDIFGGGFVTDLIKHAKLSNASQTMQVIDYKMKELQTVMGDTHIPVDYTMNQNEFLTFADFMFDGIFVDAFMASKIMTSLEEVRKLEQKLLTLREKLNRM